MRQAFKWPGFALVALGIAVFPFAIWYPGPWGVMSLVMIMFGCVLLVLALRGSGLVALDEQTEAPGDGGVGNDPNSNNGDKPSA